MSSAATRTLFNMATPVEMIQADGFGTCPVPKADYDRILLGHGSGGRLTADLIQRVFVPAFGNDVLAALEDQAIVRLPPSPPVPLPRGERGEQRSPPPLRGEGLG